MTDTSHWIDIPPFGAPCTELTQEQLLQDFEFFKHRVRLVPGRVWRDYQRTAEKLASIRGEFETYNAPVVTVHAPYVPRSVPPVDAETTPTHED